MGGSSSSQRVRHDFDGPVEIDGKKVRCSLFQAEGILTLRGQNIHKTPPHKIWADLLHEKIDTEQRGWGISKIEKNFLEFRKK